MNIWFAAAIPAQSRGGVAVSMMSLAQGCRNAGHRVRTVFGAGAHPVNYIAFALKLGLKVAAAGPDRPDVVVARSTDGLFAALAARLLRLRTRVVLHNHGWEPLVYEVERRLPSRVVSSPTTWRARLVRFPLLWCTRLAAHAVMSGTVHETRWLKRRYPRRAGAYVYVPNGVGCGDQPEWLKTGRFPDRFLAVANHTWKKNLEHVRAVTARLRAALPEASFYFVGTGPVDMTPLFDRSGLPQEAVTVVPSSPPEEMDRWYRSCPYLISASRYEGGHSFALLEAMAQGAVVFATPIFSSVEIVTDRRNGFVITGHDAGRDAATIRQALANPQALGAVRLQAYHAAVRNRWERQVRRFLRMTERIHG